MQGCQFDISIFHRIPTAIVRPEKGRIDGMDGQILFILAESKFLVKSPQLKPFLFKSGRRKVN